MKDSEFTQIEPSPWLDVPTYREFMGKTFGQEFGPIERPTVPYEVAFARFQAAMAECGGG